MPFQLHWQNRMPASRTSASPTTKQKGDAAEARALEYLQHANLRLIARNYRTPGRGGGEIDLVEVRSRRSGSHGGAAASVSAAKQKHIVFAATRFLSRLASLPPCRFDVVTVQAGEINWIKGAFDAF
jgi:putative endonuclease